MAKWEFLLNLIDWIMWGFAFAGILFVAGFLVLFVLMVVVPK